MKPLINFSHVEIEGISGCEEVRLRPPHMVAVRAASGQRDKKLLVTLRSLDKDRSSSDSVSAFRCLSSYNFLFLPFTPVNVTHNVFSSILDAPYTPPPLMNFGNRDVVCCPV